MYRCNVPRTRKAGLWCGVVLVSLCDPVFFGSSPEATAVAANNPGAQSAEQAALLSLVDRVNLALRLAESEIVELAQPRAIGELLTLDVPIGGEMRTLMLRFHSNRAPGYTVLAQQADGSLLPVAPGPVRTMRGVVEGAGAQASRVCASWLDDGWYIKIELAGEAPYWVQPLPPALREDAAQHVVYRCGDVIPGAWRCGMPDLPPGLGPQPDQAAAKGGGDGGGGGGGGGIAGAPCTLLLACDADYEYFQDYGSTAAVAARIEAIINAVNVQYEAEVNISHQLGTIVVRTSADDPYTQTESSALLCEFITEWRDNLWGIPRHMAQLFTGREIDENVIGQAADIGDVCNKQGCCNCGTYGSDGSYCEVQSDYNGAGATAFSCVTDLSAHEMGHLWGGQHCPCVEPPYTMNPFIVCGNVHSPVFSIPLITQYRDTRPCLENCEELGAVNDDCANAIPIFDGVTAFSTAGATTDGNANPGSGAADMPPGTCQWDGQTYNDIWFTYVATCTSNVTVALCGSGYDTDLVIYEGAACTPTSASVLGCNDDGCTQPPAPSLQSILTVPVVTGQTYLMRVGGWQSPDYGSGTITITPDTVADSDADGVANCDDNCPCISNADQADGDNDGIGDACAGAPDCNDNGLPDSCDIASGSSADANGDGIPDECGPPDTCPPDIAPGPAGDGVVDVNDLLILIGAWGACPPPCPAPGECEADINEDCTVDVNDLLLLIGAWGPCV